MLLDPTDWSLTERGDEVLSQASAGLAGHCAAETHEAALELRTAPHQTVHEAIAELRELRLCSPAIWRRSESRPRRRDSSRSAMTEPTKVSPSSRYQVIYRTMRDLARRSPTFALHVHVGVPDPQRRSGC